METAPAYIHTKDFGVRYKVIRKIKDPLLGEASLFKDNNLQKTVIVKEKEIKSEAQFEAQIKNCELLLKLNNTPSFTQLIGYTYKVSTSDNKEKSCLFYEIREYIENDLEKEVANRLRSRDLFSELELWKMTQRITLGLSKLQNHNTYHGNIRPKNILITKEGDFKVHWSNFHQIAYDQLLDQTLPLDVKCVPPPEVLESYSNNRSPPDYNPLFSDVFSLGLTILYASALGDIDDIYDWGKMTIKINRLNYKLSWLKAAYSERLYQVIGRMLQFDPCTRSDFQSLVEYINYIANGKGFYNFDLNSSGMVKTASTTKFLANSNKKKSGFESSQKIDLDEIGSSSVRTYSPLRSITLKENSRTFMVGAECSRKEPKYMLESINMKMKQNNKKEENLQEKEIKEPKDLLRRTFSPIKSSSFFQ